MKRLYRDKIEGKIAGVCSGLGDYFDVDPVLVRLFFVFLALWHGVGILAYIAAWIIVPEKPPIS